MAEDRPVRAPLPLGAAPLVTIVEAARRTGVGAITLRMWERRYGVPRPSRTPAGYRLYSARDLRDIAALLAHRESGIAIRQAAFLVARQRTLGPEHPSASRIAAWRRRLEAACIRFDDAAAERTLDDASSLMTISELLDRVVFPVVATMGEGRDSGVISISQEHFASELARRLVSRQDAGVRNPARGVVLTGCAPGEFHELGLLSVVCRLRDAGYRVVHLGTNVPVAAFLSTLDAVRPRTVVVGVTMGAHLRGWVARRAAVDAHARRGIRFLWAGPGAAAARGRLAGLVSNSIDEVVAAAAADSESQLPSRRRPSRSRTARVRRR
jgi:DNA-binding transcriptional MerR regulator